MLKTSVIFKNTDVRVHIGWSEAEGQDKTVAGSGPAPHPSWENNCGHSLSQKGEITLTDERSITSHLNL